MPGILVKVSSSARARTRPRRALVRRQGPRGPRRPRDGHRRPAGDRRGHRDPLVASLVETSVAELLAAELWRAQAEPALPLRLSDDHGLRLLEESDAPELYALIDANRAYLARWMPWAGGQDLAGTADFIRATRRQLAANDGFQAAIVAGERIVGVIGFHAIDRAQRSTSIGYWLEERSQGAGVVTRAVRALVDHAFSVWRLHRIEIRVAPANSRSRAIPERLGFREEGTLRAAERVGDRYLDSVVYARLATDPC